MQVEVYKKLAIKSANHSDNQTVTWLRILTNLPNGSLV